MKRKALESLKAAQRLVETRASYGYNSSIHCSYYAILQYMKYELAECKHNPVSYDKQNEKGNGNSHEFIISEIKQRISRPQDARIFVEIVRNLKKYRVEADYTQRNFTEEESLECKEQAENAIRKLDNYFKAI